MLHPYTRIETLLNTDTPSVLVSVALVAGSAPREPGARMIVTGNDIIGSIGGGRLEYEAIGIARKQLRAGTGSTQPRLELFPLGPGLGQCCGGAVVLLFECCKDLQTPTLARRIQAEKNREAMVMVRRILEDAHRSTADFMMIRDRQSSGTLGGPQLDKRALGRAEEMLGRGEQEADLELESLDEGGIALPRLSDVLIYERIPVAAWQIVIFGAGHVGRALVNCLANARPCHITWIDSRADQFPEPASSNVECLLRDDPVAEIAKLPPQAWYLVMTHDHQLDQALCNTLLEREDTAFIGLIGSATKSRRFRKRLLQAGISGKRLQDLCCPIGLPGITAKQPQAIAIAVAAQLLQLYEADKSQILPRIADSAASKH